MPARRRRRTTTEDKNIAQEMFLDSDSEEELMSHDSDIDSDQDEIRRPTMSGLKGHQLAGNETRSALLRERVVGEVSCVSREEEEE